MNQRQRIRFLIQEAIEKLRLDLSGLTILTETGSGYFSLTPIIAAYANAAKVYAWTRDSSYGKGTHNIGESKKLLGKNNLKSRVVFRLNRRPSKDIETADIITNLGFVRPLNEDFVSRTKSGAVVSLMCEEWELRSDDIDIDACRRYNVRVGGVRENHPRLKIFDSVGALAIKLCHEAGLEVYQNKIAIWSKDEFGKVIKKAFEDCGADKVFVINRNSDFERIAYKTRLDFLFIADYGSSAAVIGNRGMLDTGLVSKQVGAVIHLCGEVDFDFASSKGLTVYPQANGKSQRMTKTLAYLGPKPVIDLHAAGLKVGEALYRNKKSEFAERIV